MTRRLVRHRKWHHCVIGIEMTFCTFGFNHSPSSERSVNSLLDPIALCQNAKETHPLFKLQHRTQKLHIQYYFLLTFWLSAHKQNKKISESDSTVNSCANRSASRTSGWLFCDQCCSFTGYKHSWMNMNQSGRISPPQKKLKKFVCDSRTV